MTVTPFNADNRPDPFTIPVPARTQQTTSVDHFDRLDRWLLLFMRTAEAAKVLSRTSFIPDAMRGKPEEVATAMMRSLELGIDPLDGLSNLHVIKGKVGYSAEFMRRRIIEAGHDIEFDEQTDERCKIRGRRQGSDKWQTVTFTAAQARQAKIDLGLYAADKLVARASSRLCRRVFPDVLAGATIIEDVIDNDEASPEPLVEPSGPAPLQRKRQPRKPVPASQPPVATVEPAPPSDLDQFPGDWDKNMEAQRQATIEAAAEEQAAAEEVDAEKAGDDEDDGEDIRLISTAQLKKLSVLLREAGFSERQARHDFVAAAVGHPITSAKDLTLSEASNLIDLLEHDRPDE